MNTKDAAPYLLAAVTAAQHTPGPWEVRATSGRADAAPSLHVVAPVLGARGREDSIMRGDFCRSEADAYLIAAAPDLLAALRLLTIAAQKVPPGAHVPPNFGDAIAAARAALAKADAP